MQRGPYPGASSTVGAVTDPQAGFKQQAAEAAAAEVRSGMAVGLGTGSTAIFAPRRICALLQRGELRDVVGVAPSQAHPPEGQPLGIPMLAEELHRSLDPTIRAADDGHP